MKPGFELIIDKPIAHGGKTMLKALSVAMPEGVGEAAPEYTGSHRWICIYGAGASFRQIYIKKHIAKGGRVLVWDLGYWDRDDSYRMSIDGLHPKPQHLEQAPKQWRHKIVLREDADPKGPIVLIGLGVKSSALLFEGKVGFWEENALKGIQQRFPGKKVLWRPKGKANNVMPGTLLRSGGPIEEVIKGASLVVCRHSNVAVDACIAGVPVLCEDGAARALYHPTEIRIPTKEQRLEFLQRLGWFNWRVSEARLAWPWILQLTGEMQ